MKNLVKIAAVAVLSLGLNVAAQAQEALANMNVNAEVFDQIQVGVEKSLNFGQIMTGTQKTIGRDNVATSSAGNASQNDVQVGVFRLLAGAGSLIDLQFTLPQVLDGPTGSNASMNLTYANDMAAWANSVTYVTANQNAFDPKVPFAFGNSFPTNSLTYAPNAQTPNVTTTSNGVYVFIGAEVDAAGAVSGEYTGVIILTATYN